MSERLGRLKTQYRNGNYSSSMGLRAVLSKASLVDKTDSIETHIKVHQNTQRQKKEKKKARFDVGKKRKKKKEQMEVKKIPMAKES